MLKLTSDEGVDIKYHYYEAASPANFVDFIIAPAPATSTWQNSPARHHHPAF